MDKYTGSCHCKAVAFSFEGEIEKFFTCNCSHCSVKAFQLLFLPKSQFTLLSGEENLTEYRFGKKSLAHLFCKTCGVQCFATGKDEKGNGTVAINLRTVEDIDLTNVPTQEFNGRDF